MGVPLGLGAKKFNLVLHTLILTILYRSKECKNYIVIMLSQIGTTYTYNDTYIYFPAFIQENIKNIQNVHIWDKQHFELVIVLV